MRKERGIKFLKFFNLLSFILMVAVNALANIIPLNGITTGGVSEAYPNLFAPAGITFSIWGVIYLLLAAFVVYQLRLPKGINTTDIIERIGSYFIISSVANAAWIFSWHYDIIPLSMLLMSVILICLIIINARVNSTPLTLKEKLFVRLPFSVYFGWITVATIANATTLLVSLGWDGLGISQQVWTIIILGVGLFITMATTLKYKDIAYGLVVFWAYLGIFIKHISSNGFAGKYPEIIVAVTICLIVILITVLYVGGKQKKIIVV